MGERIDTRRPPARFEVSTYTPGLRNSRAPDLPFEKVGLKCRWF